MRIVILLSFILFYSVLCDDSLSCNSPDAQLSCGQCIQANPQCAWCRDPHALSSNRCQLKSDFNDNICDPNYVYAPFTELKISPHNLPLESKRGDLQTIVQLEPQQVVLKLKPGDSLIVPFNYVHHRNHRYEVKDFFIQTSDYSKHGVDLQFIIQCNGEEIEGRTCPDIQEGQRVAFSIKVTVRECGAAGDMAISVGIHGYQSVSALFITPLCGCECEKTQQQEKNSPLCDNNGNLICGQCVCNNGRGGDRCECNLAEYGVTNAQELDEKCIAHGGNQTCNGHGLCKCGKCHCNQSTRSGLFCECDHSTCPRGGRDNSICGGNGICDCGICKCESGWEHDDCTCSTDKRTCFEDGTECSNNGHCSCGKCICNEGFTGAFCGSADQMYSPQEKKDGEGVDDDDSYPSGGGAQPVTDSSSSHFIFIFFIFFTLSHALYSF